MAEKKIKKCYHCGEPLERGERVCPRCGADVNEDREPHTIYELRAWCARRNMPLEKMRFFLGEDCREPRAFGIYQDDDGDFVVYKNKADGVRAVRYRGPDEAHAVREIYQKLLSEIDLRRQKKRGQSGGAPNRSGGSGSAVGTVLTLTMMVIVIAVVTVFVLFLGHEPRRGYYRYDGDYYYSQDGDWYYYDDDTWLPYEIDGEFADNSEDYYVGDWYSGDYGVEDFYDSGYYVEPGDDDDWDDDDWDDWDDDDWDDWDDFDTDWDSDW